MEIVDDPKDIILDIVMCDGATIENVDATTFNTIGVAKRAY